MPTPKGTFQDAGSAQSSIATNAPVAIIFHHTRRLAKGAQKRVVLFFLLDPSGYDAGKKINGSHFQRHILFVDFFRWVSC